MKKFLIIRAGDSSGLQRAFIKNEKAVTSFLRKQGKSDNFRYDLFCLFEMKNGKFYSKDINWKRILK